MMTIAEWKFAVAVVVTFIGGMACGIITYRFITRKRP